MPNGLDSVITHSTVDRVLLAVDRGADCMDHLLPRCNTSVGSVLRAVHVLVEEGFVFKNGPRHALTYHITLPGKSAARRVRAGERRVDRYK